MDSGYLGAIILAVVVVVAIVVARVVGAKARLPPLPPFGPLPLPDLPKYFSTTEPAIAWEAVRGWQLNEAPPNLGAPGTIDQTVLTPRLLNFCTGRSGRLALSFNFLVAAIQRVDFRPDLVPPQVAPPGFGLVSIHTPSGQTLMVASPSFAQALDHAVRSAR
jgi:hypothetical protein